MNLSDWRIDYDKYSIDEGTLPVEPFALFKDWFDKAILDQNPEPNAFVLATCADNQPQSRVVLLKEIEDAKFVFYTNYLSQKGRDIEKNPRVSLLFFYPFSQRQIRINGIVEKLSREKAVEYFRSRPQESQISAIASPQSQVIGKQQLAENAEQIRQRSQLECPEHWGGYAVKPNLFEFWQGQPARLHDRIVYKILANHSWEKYRLAP